MKQVDFDGAIAYSNFIASECVSENLGLLIYPNPASQSATISLRNVSKVPSELIIYDAQGRPVYQEHYELNAHDIEVDLSNLQSGVYHVTIVQDGTQYMEKLVVTNR